MNHESPSTPRNSEVDVSGLMLLADVMIELERMENIFESFPKRQRTRNRPSSSLKVDSLHNSFNGPVLSSQSQLQAEPSKKKKRPIETNDDIDEQKPRQSFSNCLNGPLTSQCQPDPSKKRKRIQANDDDNDNEYKPRQSFSNKKIENKKIKSKQKKKKKNVRLRQVKMEEETKPTPLPTWFEELARTHLYNVQPAVWVCEKLLEISDTDKGLRRLFIRTEGSEKRLKPALTEQEKGRLRQGIPVLGLDQNGKSWNLQLKYWPSIGVNVLKKDWIDLVNKNHLMAGVTQFSCGFLAIAAATNHPKRRTSCVFLLARKGNNCED